MWLILGALIAFWQAKKIPRSLIISAYHAVLSPSKVLQA
jgi:hypothetical protein